MVITGFKKKKIVSHPQLVYLSHSEVDIRYSLIFSGVTRNGKTYKSELSYQNTVWKLLFIKPFLCLEESKHSEEATSWFQAKIIPSATSYAVCWERSNVVKRKNVLRFYKSNTTLFFFVFFLQVKDLEVNHPFQHCFISFFAVYFFLLKNEHTS